MKNVILTIDTEGPRGSDPILYQVWGKVGENQYWGIPKIMDICDKYNVRALFFVDIPEIWDFGYEKVKEVIVYIKKRGHDVGVHIHPHHMPNETRQFLFEYQKDEQRDIIKRCTEKYIEIVGEHPKSFRAGKYGANRDTLDIINELGYKYDFSEFYSQKWCGIEPEVAYVLPQKYKALVEFPVTIFRSFKLGNFYQRYDKVEATNNFKEMKYVLNQYAHSLNQEIIILFLHSFSLINFLKTPDSPSISKKKLKRFEQIINYISSSEDLKFIKEQDLALVTVPENDSERNIIETKGIFRQFYYFYHRAYEIRKTNKKAWLLVKAIYFMVIVFVLVIFIFLNSLF